MLCSCVNQIYNKAFFCCFLVLQASLTYAEAQMMIDTTKNDDVTKSLRGLNKLAKILKKQRIKKG